MSGKCFHGCLKKLLRMERLALMPMYYPDLDLREGEEPKWTTHSLRRLAGTTARRHREATGTTEAEIDIFFGWHEKVLLRAMQVHYALMSIRERMAKACITGWM